MNFFKKKINKSLFSFTSYNKSMSFQIFNSILIEIFDLEFTKRLKTSQKRVSYFFEKTNTRAVTKISCFFSAVLYYRKNPEPQRQQKIKTAVIYNFKLQFKWRLKNVFNSFYKYTQKSSPLRKALSCSPQN